ncbi:MAG: L-seryl-tRNA(Sec) selenium transferase [Desulfatirhabdiaceae bacterium]
MPLTSEQKHLLKQLPAVERLLEMAESDPFFTEIPRTVRLRAIRIAIDNARKSILDSSGTRTENQFSIDRMMAQTKHHVQVLMQFNLRRTINATGIIIHTNLGRSILAKEVMDHLATTAGRYSNLEFDLAMGKRGSRYSAVEDILCEISGAESAMVVNNNAAAVLLCIDTTARGKEAIVSRGELIEIGGSFRIPDVMTRSGAILKEVGTTNRTHLRDYESAIHEQTGLLLKVHTSNYRIMGFTSGVSLTDLVILGGHHGLPVMEDLGSGTFIDFSAYGLIHEPTVQESISSGTDIVTFSGDKLLGGPQAGIILGKKALIDQIKKNPLTRALRIDKMTLAALEGTLRLYRDPGKAVEIIPTLRMLTRPIEQITERAETLLTLLLRISDDRTDIRLLDVFSQAGGGSLPLLNIPSIGIGISITGLSAAAIDRFMRNQDISIIGRIEAERFIMDVRTLMDDEFPIIAATITDLLRTLDQ